MSYYDKNSASKLGIPNLKDPLDAFYRLTISSIT